MITHTPSNATGDSEKTVLFLQGPLGPFFRELAREFSDSGYTTHKINFNGGDRWFTGADHCVDFRGALTDWPGYLEHYLIRHRIHTVFLMGDCRHYHRLARPVCEKLGVAFMVFEEGYLRPNTITLEASGVNALTSLNLSSAAMAAAPAERLYAAETMPPTMKQRILFASLYYWVAFFQRKRFSRYRHHRNFCPIIEGAQWLRGAARKQLCKYQDHRIHQRLTTLLSGQFFLVPLQVHDDSQMIYHSDYDSVEAVIEEYILSFARHSKPEDVLVFKHHPMDRGYTHYRNFISQKAAQSGLEGRVLYCHDVPLPELYKHAKGVATVNSTVGLSALLHSLPVKVTGRAFYDIPRLTSQCSLDEFWQHQEPVHSGLFDRLHNLLFRESQINGSFFAKLPLSCRNARLFYEALLIKSQKSGTPVPASHNSHSANPDKQAA